MPCDDDDDDSDGDDAAGDDDADDDGLFSLPDCYGSMCMLVNMQPGDQYPKGQGKRINAFLKGISA